MQTYSTGNAEHFEQFVANFVDSNRDMVSFQIFQHEHSKRPSPVSFTFTTNNDNPNFESEDPKEIRNQVQAAGTDTVAQFLAEKQPKGLFLKDFPTGTNLQIIQIGIPFATTNETTTYWVLASFWKNRILRSMPSSKSKYSILVDEKGEILAFTSKSSEARKVFNKKETMNMLKSVVSTGLKSYKRAEIPYIAVYRKIPEFRLMTVTESDARNAFTAVKSVLYKILIMSFASLWIAMAASYLIATQLTQSLRQLVGATLRIAKGDFDYRLNAKTSDEIGFLTAAINYMAERIGKLLSLQVEQARQEKELETARAVQETLFPESENELPFLQIAAKCKPTSECGGDWWSHFQLTEKKTLICVADATGHGASAALVTAMAFSAFKTVAKFYQDQIVSGEAPGDILDYINTALASSATQKTTMTLFLALIDLENGKITYSNAGHNFPIILPRNIDDPRVTTSKNEATVIPLKVGGNPLGFDKTSMYKSKALPLAPGDKLILFTDGLIESKNPTNAQWGRRQLYKLIESNRETSATEIRNEIVDKAFKFFDGVPPDDDVTVVVAEVSTEWQPQNVSA